MTNAADLEPFDPFAGPAIARAVPSTEPQREVWTASQLGEDANLAYNESVWLRLRGPLDAAALERALDGVVHRHESLRAMFSGDGLTMLFSEKAHVAWKVTDLSKATEGQRAAGLELALAEAVTEPFDLLAGPLLRAFRVKLAQDDHVVCIVAHHVVCDGWSTAVILREWAALYTAYARGGDASLPEPPRFADYALRLGDPARRPEQDANVDYWVKRFSDADIPVLDLPTDRPRPTIKTYASLREDHVLDEALVASLKKLGAKERASLFNVLLAGWYATLARLTNQEDLVVGIPAAGQSAEQADLLVGHCVNMLPLRTAARLDRPFRELLGASRATLLDAYDHQGFTLGTLLSKLPIRRDPSRLPLVSTIFNVDRGLGPGDLPFANLSVELHTNARRFENYEIFLNAVDLGGRVTLECQYNSDLFDRATIRRWLSAYERLLRGAVEDPGVTVGLLPLLSADEVALVEKVNAEAVRGWARDVCVHDLVFAQIEKTPDAIAVEIEGARLTYGELGAKARGLAATLAAAGVAPGDLVGLCVERGTDMLVGLLGILEAGAAYVPLDPGYPPDRLGFMVSDAKMKCVVTQRALAAELPFLRDVRAVIVEDVRPASGARGPRAGGPELPCYVIYTSGSTGKPKGVLVPHRAVANLVRSVAERPGMTSADVVLAVTTLSFDIAVSEVILPLVVGAKIVLASREVASDGERLLALLRASKATFVDATPATWRLLLAAGWEGGEGLRVICTGEAMPKDLAEALLARTASVWNGYGPTETTVWSTFWEVTRPVRSVLIGRPVANTRVWVLDPRGQRVPLGVIGELFIAGDGVSLGYHQRGDLTKERFVPEPWAPPGAANALMYKTGDLVRMLPSGDLECLGRNDNQVKVRGYRIELGEIENALGLHPAVRQAAVTVREDRPGDVRIVGYVVAPAEATDADLRAHLKQTLPEYMVPQTFVRLVTMPLTPSGKIDRKALPAPSADAPRGDDASFVAPSTETQKMLAALWQEVLGVGRVGAHDDFFALGGHSLLASQMLARLKRDQGVTLTFRKIFEAPTVEKLAAAVDAARGAGAAPARAAVHVPRRPDGAGPAPLSMAQRRLWMLEEMDPGQADVHVLHATWRLDGKLDFDVLQRAVDAIVERHDTLRTAIVRGADGEPAQVVVPDRRVVIAREDLTHLPEAERDAAMRERIERDAEPFDLARDLLLRLVLIRMSEERHVLFTLRHNIIWDGWSFDIFLSELAALYSAFVEGKPSPLPPLPIRYSDFAAWQPGSLEAPEMKAQVEYWTRKLAGNPAPLEIPTDRPRTATRGARGGNTGIHIARSKADALTALARDHGATLYMIVLAIFEVLLQRWTGQDDVLVGTPVRARTLPETEDLIGPFINAVALRTHVDPNASFLDLLAHVRDTTLDAFSHQEMPLELLGEKAPIVRAFFSLQDARNRPPGLGPLGVTQLHSLGNFAANELMLWTMETRTHLLAMLNYATELFDEATAKRLLTHFERLVDGVLENPRARVGALPMLPKDEEARIAAYLAPAAPALAPLAVALASGGDAARRARKLARAAGVRAGERVRITPANGRDAALLAVGAIGAGATVVLGPEPADREIDAPSDADAASDASFPAVADDAIALVVRGVKVPFAQAAAAALGLAATHEDLAAPARAPEDELDVIAQLAALAAGGAFDDRADPPDDVLVSRDLALPIAAGKTGARKVFARALPGLQFTVRDAAGRVAPIGVVGSVTLEAPGPSRATRDRVRVLEGGAIVHAGRADGQVDVGGALVDATMMATALASQPALSDAHVIAVEPDDDDPFLVAYVVPRQGRDVTHADLRRALRDAGFGAVPRTFVELEALPRTGEGAVDTNRLPPARLRGRDEVPPRTDQERWLAAVWRDVLGVPNLSVHDNFFDMGGHSLLCFRVVARIEQERGVRVSPRALLTGSLEQVAALLGPSESAAPSPRRESGPAPREVEREPAPKGSWLERVRSLVRR